ncbi:hypothetical protein [Paenibacillus xanthanilyticus]|uniref:Uncharacterized protein n=1 Tax=Paenibacillus xanthanilyticus TaxID=1783531 RepID=A0ABV8KBC3_9BACL
MPGRMRRTLWGYQPAAVQTMNEHLAARHAERMNGLRAELARLRSDNERLADELARVTTARQPVERTTGQRDSRDLCAPLAAAHAEASLLVEELTARLREQRMRHEADKARHARLRADTLARLEARLGEAQARWRGGEEDGD